MMKGIPNNDVNKSVIMSMLMTDLHGFNPDELEARSKEAYNMVLNGGDAVETNLKFVDGYGRNEIGYIVLSNAARPVNKKGSKGKKKTA